MTLLPSGTDDLLNGAGYTSGASEKPDQFAQEENERGLRTRTLSRIFADEDRREQKGGTGRGPGWGGEPPQGTEYQVLCTEYRVRGSGPLCSRGQLLATDEPLSSSDPCGFVTQSVYEVRVRFLRP